MEPASVSGLHHSEEICREAATPAPLGNKSARVVRTDDVSQQNTIETPKDVFKQPPTPTNKDTNPSNSPTSETNTKPALEMSNPPATKRTKVELYADDIGPYWHKVANNLVTPPIITKNLPKVFESLPIFGAPECSEKLEEFQDKKIREFVGCDLEGEEYNELASYCNPDNLLTGKELRMTTNVPVQGVISRNTNKDLKSGPDVDDGDESDSETYDLFTIKKLRNHKKKEKMSGTGYGSLRKMKYRGVRLMPLEQQEAHMPGKSLEPPDLEPGKDLLFRVRVYRPFTYNVSGDKLIRGRHSVLSCDILILGRQKLTDLRERIVCRNDLDMRLDVSQRPDEPVTTTAKALFKSGFLFINNVFYVDNRPGCKDTSAVVREWAARRGLGNFPVRDMAEARLDEILVKLAYPEVYVHQGNCEHVFLFSEIRLLNASDPLHLSSYPCHTAISQNQTIYCTTCAEFGAKWLVTGCDKVPFDPAFFCETCFKQYLYKDGLKIGDFKAFAYKGNEVNMFKHQGQVS